MAATVEKPPGALGESMGPEPDGAATEAEGAAEANNTEGKKKWAPSSISCATRPTLG